MQGAVLFEESVRFFVGRFYIAVEGDGNVCWVRI